MERKQGFFSKLKEEVVLGGYHPRGQELKFQREMGHPLRVCFGGRRIAVSILFHRLSDVEFGGIALHWSTLNGANIFVLDGYDDGMTHLDHCSPPFRMRPHSISNYSTEPNIAE